MYASVLPRIAPRLSTASAVAALFMDELERDTQGVAIPRPEVHLVVRFGPSARGGLDVHALGARQRVHRKLLRSGQRMVAARLQLGTTEASLGVPASVLAGNIVALEELWGDVSTRRLCERLAAARSTSEAAAVLEGAIAERLALGKGPRAQAGLALAAADRLASASVKAVAAGLGVSERHLLRVFREATGMGPKTFAKLARFRHAVSAAGGTSHPSWTNIAVAAGYYDQAHLISEFRTIAGVTPQALLRELRVAQALG